jgi:predicted Zn-dependent protease
MHHKDSRLLFGMVAVMVAGTVAAQQATPTTSPGRGGRRVPAAQQSSDEHDAPVATDGSDEAIAELVGWKTSAASKILDALREESGDTPEFKTAEAMLRFNKGKPEEALDLLKAASAAAPSNPAPEYYRGEVWQAQDKSDAARSAWVKARDRGEALVKAQAKNARAQYYLGAALVRMEEPDLARKALTVAEREGFDPRLTGYQTGLSRVQQKQWEQAVEVLSAVIELDDRFAPAYFYRGLVWSKLDRKDLMLEDLTRFLALAPSAPEADTARALVAAFAG